MSVIMAVLINLMSVVLIFSNMWYSWDLHVMIIDLSTYGRVHI